MDSEYFFIIHQFITLFVAGTDTTATTCGTALYFLAKYPEIQEEILEEINTVIGDNEVTDAHLNKLVRIGGLIQEVLRFKNPAFAAIIRIVKQDKQLMDVKLKKGWFAIQYHSASSIKNEHFDNPNVFDYKRWISDGEVIKNDNGFVHIPFAAGPRNCIGQHMAQMEAKIMIALLIRKYQVELNPEVKDIYFDLKLLYSQLLQFIYNAQHQITMSYLRKGQDIEQIIYIWYKICYLNSNLTYKGVTSTLFLLMYSPEQILHYHQWC